MFRVRRGYMHRLRVSISSYVGYFILRFLNIRICCHMYMYLIIYVVTCCHICIRICCHMLSVCVLVDAPAWFSSTRSINCKSRKDGVFSRVHTAVRNARTSAPNLRDRLGPSRSPRCSPRWMLRSHRCPWSLRYSPPPINRVVVGC